VEASTVTNVTASARRSSFDILTLPRRMTHVGEKLSP
jgi:hypothetical protein